jgi:putative redox protein
MTGRTIGETIVVDETKLSLFQVKVKTGSSTFLADQPIGNGGLGSGPNPYDLLSAAIGTCSLMVMRLYADNKKWPLDRVRVKVTHRRGGPDARDIFIKEVQLIGSLNDGQKAKILDVSMRSPVERTMKRGSDIRTILLANGPMDDGAVSRYEHMRDITALCK